MPDRPPSDADEDSRRLRRSFLIAVCFTGALWAIKLAELALGLDLARYSIYPGDPATLTGLLFAPLLHGSFGHLFANTAPMLVLGTALLYGYPKAARVALPILYLGSGLAVWFFARPSWHLGASGLTFGLLFFLFTMGVVRWERRAIALALAVFLTLWRDDLGTAPHRSAHLLRVPPGGRNPWPAARGPVTEARSTGAGEDLWLGAGGRRGSRRAPSSWSRTRPGLSGGSGRNGVL